MTVEVLFKKLHPDAVIPQYKTAGSAGADMYSVEDVDIEPGEVRAVRLGFAVAIPQGYEIQVRPRSGLALEHNITVMNSPGTVDSDYRGEMKVILANLGDIDFLVRKGDRIAQCVIAAVPTARFCEVDKLDETSRGSGGFGSTGRK